MAKEGEEGTEKEKENGQQTKKQKQLITDAAWRKANNWEDLMFYYFVPPLATVAPLPSTTRSPSTTVALDGMSSGA